MSEFEIISAIENYVTSHAGVTDSSIEPTQIAAEIDTLRLRFLREFEKTDRLGRIPRSYSQRLGPVETQEYEINDRNYMGIVLPRLYFRDNGKAIVFYLGSDDMDNHHRIVYGKSFRNFESELYTSRHSTAWIDGERLLFLNTSPESVILDAVYADPSDLGTGSLNFYDPRNDDYPCPEDIKDMIIGKTAESYIRTLYRTMPQSNKQVDLPVAGNS